MKTIKNAEQAKEPSKGLHFMTQKQFTIAMLVAYVFGVVVGILVGCFLKC